MSDAPWISNASVADSESIQFRCSVPTQGLRPLTNSLISL